MSSRNGARKHLGHKYKKPPSKKNLAHVFYITCEGCGKQCFPSRKAARQGADRIHPGTTLHVYECRKAPGWWHYTSWSSWQMMMQRDEDRRRSEQG